MTAALKRKLSAEEYPVVERAAKFKSEFYQGEMIATSGARYFHNRILANPYRQLGTNWLEAPVMFCRMICVSNQPGIILIFILMSLLFAESQSLKIIF
jgi:hypothetical protein